jgi:hypothetical protein
MDKAQHCEVLSLTHEKKSLVRRLLPRQPAKIGFARG